MKLLDIPTKANGSSNERTANTWRLFVDFDLSAALNMALDETLLDSVIGGAEPALRLYTWRPATLSLGVNQPVGEVEPVECARRGFDLVRRMTGGRAVLHQHELTYSVIARESDPLVSGGVIESYRKISEALVAGLSRLGANVALAPPNRSLRLAQIEARRSGEQAPEGASHGAVCFDAASDYELTAGGRKIVGSAQARRGGALLQHGSILLDIDWDAWGAVFAYRSAEGRQRAVMKLPTRMTSLREQLGRAVTREEAAEAITSGFAETFRLTLNAGRPTPDEIGAASRLAVEKYGHDGWTLRK
jgi:lipoyl(octanoyl) transferase